MRLRLGLLIAAVFATLLSPISPQALAAGGYASAPQSVTASAIAGGVRVGWSAPADVDTGITGYRVEYSTSGGSGSWVLAASVGSGLSTYDILGLSQVAIYVRVAATTSAGTGTFGYPWTKIYGTTSTNRNGSGQIDYESGYGLGGSDPYTTMSAASFSRIKYRMDTTISSVSRFVEADFYEWVRGDTAQTTAASLWDPSISSIMIPTPTTYTYSIQANVTDLNVYSNHSNVSRSNGSTGFAGRLEIWPYNYGTEVTSLSDGSTSGSGSTYDFNDTSQGAAGYGSFQVHDLTNYKPVFAWNNHSNGAVAEIGYGKNTGTHPDWTFCAQGGGMGSCPTPSYFRLQIFANIPVTPLADATPPTVSRGDARSLIRSGETILVRSTEIGTVYLVRNTVTVTNLASITAAAANVKNSVSIVSINTSTTLTTSGLLDGTYNLYAVDSANNVSTGLLATVALDTTPPAATSFSVNSSGTSILMAIGETSTLASFDANAYSVSDSGSALSVTSASFSGLVITLNLSRAIPTGATVTFAYTPSGVAIAGRWVDFAGNQLNSVSSRTITNNSNVQVSIGLAVADSMSRNTSITISASADVAGRVTFTIAGKRIPGCLNKVASGSTPITVTCTFKPALSGWQRITATLVPTLGAYPTTINSVDRFISKRTNLR